EDVMTVTLECDSPMHCELMLCKSPREVSDLTSGTQDKAHYVLCWIEVRDFETAQKARPEMITGKEVYIFNTLAEWSKGRSGIVEQTGAVPESIDFSAPPEFHGEENKWSPETLLLSAIAACFVSTFSAIAEYSAFMFNTLTVSVEGTVARVNGKLQFTNI